MCRHSHRLKLCKVLVVDEISMISGEFLELASYGLGQARNRPGAPFGGLQVVLCGDFLQLPPVSSDAALQRPGACRFAFQAPIWEKMELRSFELTQNFRQAADEAFQGTLRRIRIGCMSDADRRALLGESLTDEEQKRRAAAQRTTLYCRNVDVERENLSRLASLPGDVVVAKSEDTFNILPGGGSRAKLEQQLQKCMAASEVRLKVGARVMLLKNIRLPSACKEGESPLVNGSVGDVLALEAMADGHVQVFVQFDSGACEYVSRQSFTGTASGVGDYTRIQLPLKLAWAVSVHKSQGMTLDGGLVDLRGAFEEGQVYVALSRFRCAKFITVTGLPPQLRVSSQALDFHERLTAQVATAHVADGGG
eukprot:TRINITY_DN105633_c0_g1_i1.p1 TRINITY_DN105633_c0_g1~~TRINITY_DN105633_c0_g1_i1.p1  ORF type:complete len:414 (+),score=99.71 TRINITY_DN105633_c0_g1_i1:146-1243(+)